ncbi:ATP-binding cassette sub-family C member 4-like [Uranotaenia lowii]|uniref:ATP-binding cassette sub-family C member 4-like n=1 Tax=Uranotaenia lowii TaxID=190385 RepID=UPI002479387D|nr:ATP-binding cassette sub-family C member 4-like [Uranotaenia lowii]
MNRDKDFSKNKHENPICNASFLSRRTFWWLKEIFRAGQQKQITEELLYATLPEHRSHELSDMFERLWAEERAQDPNKEPNRQQPSLFRTLYRAYGNRTLFWGLLFSVIETANRVAQPLLLGGLLSYFSPGQTEISEREAYYFAAGVIICSLIPVLTFHPFILFIFEIGMKARIGCSCLIYNKCLRLTKSATGAEGLSGKVLNLLSNDVGKFDVALAFVHDLWKGPMESILLGYLIYREIGISGIIGMSFLLGFIPLQAYIGKKTATYRLRAAKRTDLRIRFMNEIIQGIQVIKMYTWENSFAKMVEKVRRKEINAIRGGAYVRATLISFSIVSRVSLFLSLLAYTLSGEFITARKVFIVSSFYAILNDSMVHFWPMAITFCTEGFISVKRVQEFLLTPEGKERVGDSGSFKSTVEPEKDGEKKEKSNGAVVNDTERMLVAKRIVNENSEKKGIVLDGVTARWVVSEDESNVGIENVSTTVEQGRLCVVIGPVGSGKTTLLNVILGELDIDEGSLLVNGNLSYAAQEPWLFEGSVRNNILFVEEYDEQRYLEVVRVCALERDFQLFPHGDQTIVGERGISLSGGQKARVNLARAIYKKSDVYLLDDPLSAVDAHVGKHIYEMCIRDFLADKVCVLVTHQLQYLKDVQHIILMNTGTIDAQGSYHEIKRTKLDSILALTPDESPSENKFDKEFEKQTAQTEQVDLFNEKQEEEQETQGEGQVSFSVYKTYIAAINSCGWVFFISALIVLTQVAVSSVDFFVAQWVNWEESLGHNNSVVFLKENQTIEDLLDFNVLRQAMAESNHDEERQQYIVIYSILIGVFIYLTLQRTFSFFYVCLRISINLHDRMFRGLTHATMSFFNNNPSGRILNRFSKDIGAIDSTLPMSLIDCLKFFLEMIAVVALVSIVNYWFLLPTSIIAVLMFFIRRVYLNASRPVKRIESVNRSPIFSHTNATLQGLSTIRAFQAQKVLCWEFSQHMDMNTAAWYIFITTTRAFALWLDFICVIYIAVVTLSFLVMGQDALGGSVGLAITQTISLIGMCQWGMRQSAELENQMVSVERVNEYTNLPAEPPMETAPKYRPQRNWPENGVIKYNNVDLRYTEDGDRVLKDLSFVIQSNEKIGVVGRTGAGKSSLIQALFRLAPFEGAIEIDDIDTKTLGLKDLRSKISIIPQDPILFSGTLRSNLDPFEEKSDEELWNALEQVELKESVSSLAGGLECKMSDGGSNFSMGQRQLVCLARAILRNNKILVLDEATANVDPETDKLIQNTIRQKFSDCTVLTIAHRLHTVMDSDRVLVMDAGRVVEFGHPHELLHGPIGYLRRLVEQTGVATAATLMRIADENHKKLKNQ